MAATDSLITIQDASPEHIPSMSTLFARSFHPTNSFMRKCFPDTPTIRAWWAELLEKQLAGYPASRILVALDGDATDAALKAVGFLLLRRFTPECRGSGIFTMCTFTPDHNFAPLLPGLEAMTEFRERLYLGKGRDHFMVELFGVDAVVKGGGVGSRLLRRVCEIADEEGLEVCVQANANARSFYEKIGGFKEVESMLLEGGYSEHMMVRPRTGGK